MSPNRIKHAHTLILTQTGGQYYRSSLKNVELRIFPYKRLQSQNKIMYLILAYLNNITTLL